MSKRLGGHPSAHAGDDCSADGGSSSAYGSVQARGREWLRSGSDLAMGAYGDQTHPTSPGRSSFLPMAPSGLCPLVGALGPVDWEQEARKRQRGALAEAAVLQAVRQGGVSPRAAQQTMQPAGPVGPSLPISALSAGSGALPANLQSDLLYMMRRSLEITVSNVLPPRGTPGPAGWTDHNAWCDGGRVATDRACRAGPS